MNRLYLDDMSVGMKFSSGTYLMDEAGIKAFAEQFDPQPFHLDEAAARERVPLQVHADAILAIVDDVQDLDPLLVA